MLFVCVHGGRNTCRWSFKAFSSHVCGVNEAVHNESHYLLMSLRGLTSLRRRNFNEKMWQISAFLREWVCLSADRVSVSPINSCKGEGARNFKPKHPILTKYTGVRWEQYNDTPRVCAVEVWSKLLVVVPPLTNESSLVMCLLVSTWVAIQAFNTQEMHTTAVVIVGLL